VKQVKNEVLRAIYGRRSRREFTEEPVAARDLDEIMRAGIWAPSGLNNQPWRFVVVQSEAGRRGLAALTKYGHIVLGAPALVAVYLDKEAMYNEVKDHQAAGACMQNMLLAAESLSLGAVWLGQILENDAKVNELLGLTGALELQGVIALGHPRHRNQRSQRGKLEDFVIKRL